MDIFLLMDFSSTNSGCFLPDGLQVICLVLTASSLWFTPADRAPVVQPWGIIVPPARDEKDFFQIESFLQRYLLLVLEHLFVPVRDETQLPFTASDELLMMLVWSIIKWSWFGKPGPITRRGWKFLCDEWFCAYWVHTCDWADWELGRIDGQIEYWTVRLNIECTDCKLTLSPLFFPLADPFVSA